MVSMCCRPLSRSSGSGTMRSRVGFDSMSSFSWRQRRRARLSFGFRCSGVSKISGTVIFFSTMASAPELTSVTLMRAM